jgi:hypothetical protein
VEVLVVLVLVLVLVVLVLVLVLVGTKQEGAWRSWWGVLKVERV